MNADDKDIERYLKLLTLLETEEIQTLVSEHNTAPEKRLGQKKLAFEVVKIIHGEDDADVCEKITDFLFGNDFDKLHLLQSLSQEEFALFYEEIGGIEYKDQNLFGLFIESGLEKSGGTTRQSLSSGALYINEQKLTDNHYDFSGDFIDDKFLLIRKGKKNFRIIKK